MALQGQPPWYEGNPQGYILIEEDRNGFAITVQVIQNPIHAPRIVLAEWVRHHAGGRDAEPDDYFWKVMDGLKAVGLSLGQLATLNKVVEENT